MTNSDRIRSVADRLLRNKWEPDTGDIEEAAHELYEIAHWVWKIETRLEGEREDQIWSDAAEEERS